MGEKPIWWTDRRSLRLSGHGYTGPETYFVTLCSYQNKCLFGEVVDGQIRLSEIGLLVQKEWLRTAQVRPYIELDTYVVMPNHLHAVLIFTGENLDSVRIPRAKKEVGPTLVAGSLGAVIAQFKSIVTKRSRAMGLKGSIWQRNYYEQMIQDEESLNGIREYIETNPSRWHLTEKTPKLGVN